MLWNFLGMNYDCLYWWLEGSSTATLSANLINSYAKIALCSRLLCCSSHIHKCKSIFKRRCIALWPSDINYFAAVKPSTKLPSVSIECEKMQKLCLKHEYFSKKFSKKQPPASCSQGGEWLNIEELAANSEESCFRIRFVLGYSCIGKWSKMTSSL
jgi:hypothetical protein